MSTTTDQGYATGRARRAQIVKEATQEFAVAGFKGATMLDIAQRVGISRAGILHHFPSKEALLEAVLEARDIDDRASFQRRGPAERGGLGVLRGMVDLAAHNTKSPGIIALFVMLSAEATAEDHPAHDYFIERYSRILQGTQAALERAATAGFLAADVDPAGAAVELTALMDGLQVLWLLSPDSIDMPGQIRAAIQRLIVVPI